MAEQEITEAPRRGPKRPVPPYYRACRDLKVGAKTYKKGQVVPEAMTWLRPEAWVRSRHVELVEA